MVATLTKSSRDSTGTSTAEERRPSLRLLAESTIFPSTTDFSVEVAAKVREYLLISWLNDWTLMEGRWATWQEYTLFSEHIYDDTDDTMDDTPVLFDPTLTRAVTLNVHVAAPTDPPGSALEEPLVEYDEPILFEPQVVRTVSLDIRYPRPAEQR